MDCHWRRGKHLQTKYFKSSTSIFNLSSFALWSNHWLTLKCAIYAIEKYLMFAAFSFTCVEKPVSTLRKDDQVGLHGLLLNLPGLGETDVACQMHRFSGGPPWSPHLSSHRAGQHGEDDHHLGRRFRCFAYALQSIPLSLAFPLSL